ncbi:serine/threonine protein kinase [Candidatus Marinamargulisbacteria bacterium SCGC AG-343-D04]|nr:serine/threonine protein kinase [Candidatus Marinamargulisbacteria bacterium SCGC AG-343-D04]
MIWESLTLESAMQAVEDACQQRLTNVCIPRNSYINRVYEMELDSQDRVIAKFYRPNRWSTDMILGEHFFLKHAHDNDLPVIPPLTFNDKTLFMLDEIPFALFPKKGGRVMDEFNEDLWKETGRLLGRLHNLGQTITDSGRMKWRPKIATTRHLKTLCDCGVIPEDYRAVSIRAIEQFIQKADSLFSRCEMFLIHGDCHYGNIIYRPGEHVYLVDFDDVVIGPSVQDVWMLLPDETGQCKQELAWFQEGYSVFRDFSARELDLIPALRIMRQIHFAAWCAVQSQEAHFQHHFPDWGSTKYWNEWVKSILGF